jgi:DNA-binding response OmpR family regulator
MKVLLVDDEEELVSALTERLCLRGIEAEGLTSAEAALKRVETSSFDVAVLDVKMPRISGLELMQRLAAIRPHMQFVFLTGYGSEVDFQQVATRCGEANYLVKPVDIEELIAKMNALMTCERGAS